MTSDQERAAPAQQPVAWRCDECGCASYARMDERKPEGGFGPSPLVRCVNCKKVHNVPAASEPELRAEIVRLTRERDELRLAIAGKPMLDGLYHGQYLEMAHTLHAACAGGRERAEAAWSRVEALSAEVGTARAAAFEEAAQIADEYRATTRRYNGDHKNWDGRKKAAEWLADAIRSRAALDKGATA